MIKFALGASVAIGALFGLSAAQAAPSFQSPAVQGQVAASDAVKVEWFHSRWRSHHRWGSDRDRHHDWDRDRRRHRDHDRDRDRDRDRDHRRDRY